MKKLCYSWGQHGNIAITVGYNMEKLATVGENVKKLVTFGDNMGKLDTVTDNMEKLVTVGDNMEKLATVRDNMEKLVKVGDNKKRNLLQMGTTRRELEWILYYYTAQLSVISVSFFSSKISSS